MTSQSNFGHPHPLAGMLWHAVRLPDRPVDVMTGDSIHRVLRPRIEATALRVF